LKYFPTPLRDLGGGGGYETREAKKIEM
jgi:hypothetical protein